MKARLMAICVVCAAAACGCSESGTLPTQVTSAFEQAFTRHDVDATLALFSADAQILPQNGPVVNGRAEIEAYLKDTMTPRVQYDTETDMTLVSGQLGVEQGSYWIRDVRRGADVEQGKYVHVWRRQDGAWKLYRMIFNTDVARRTEVDIAPAASEEG
jgi:ketosteroid isomerase-like protein